MDTHTHACQSSSLLLQDPRRYFEQAVDTDAAPAGDAFMQEPGASISDVLKSINPHALQSGMTSAAAKLVCYCLAPLLYTEDCPTCCICPICAAA